MIAKLHTQISSLLYLCLATFGAADRAVALMPPAQDLEKVVDQFMIEFDHPDTPGAAVGIFHNNSIHFQKGYGQADLEAHGAVADVTNFRIASLTKAFTATAVLQLVESGLVSLDDSLVEIFPNFPPYGAAIKIRHLLNHTSGLIDYESLIPPDYQGQVTDHDVLLLMLKQRGTYHQPGSKFRYSNTGYALLAELVAMISQKTFQAYLSENIFQPLGMHDSVAYVEGDNEVSNRAFGYSPVGGGFKRTDQSPTSAVLGDGGVYSSVQDLSIWYQMWNGGTGVLSAASIQQMLTPGRLNDNRPISYGFGWFIDKFDGRNRISHTGSTIGQKHAIAFFPEEQFGVLILTNRENAAPWKTLDQIANWIIRNTSL